MVGRRATWRAVGTRRRRRRRRWPLRVPKLLVLMGIATDDAAGIDHPRDVAETREEDADAKLNAAAKPPPYAQRREEVGAHARADEAQLVRAVRRHRVGKWNW